MRIKKLRLKNYRQFRDVEFIFNKNSDKDLHIIEGTNGTGKTNILNAINWCLYGEEPHLSKESGQLPILNLNSINENYGKYQDVEVEIWITTAEEKYKFRRRISYKIKNKEPIRQSIEGEPEFEVMFTDEMGNTKIYTDEEADPYVKRFIPSEIREFFFFDGERLDNYFREATGQNIRHATFEIARIHLLKEVESRLIKVTQDLRKEAGKKSPKIKETNIKLEQEETKFKETNEKIEECKRQIRISESKIREYEENLRELPDTEKLEEERKKLKRMQDDERNKLKVEKENKKDLLFEYGKIIMLWPAIKNSLQTINKKREKREIPPTINKRLLENIIENDTCSICGRTLDENSKNKVKELQDQIKISSNISKQLTSMENPLRLYNEKIKNFKKKLKEKTKTIEGYEKILDDIKKRKDQIDQEISGYDIEKIKRWHQERKNYENISASDRERLGVLKERNKRKEKEIKKLRDNLNEELKKEKKAKEFREQIDFCNEALKVIRTTKEDLMSEVRKNIEENTKNMFFNLIWKKETFKDINIGPNYNISLIHSMDYECLGTVGAAERQLLALSFTLALHKVSGFDSPILIDTPVGRISDAQRENFASIFSKVSTNKQTILLFTPAEHSKEIRKILDEEASNRFTFTLTENEKETQVGVL